MNGPEWDDGWLRVPYSGDELAPIQIGIDGVLHPAYRDWAADGTRVVQVRAGEDTPGRAITVEVNGTVQASYGGGGQGRPARHGVT